MIADNQNKTKAQLKAVKLPVLLSALSAVMILTGCQSIQTQKNQYETTQYSCQLSQSKNLTEAISQSQQTLKQTTCQSNFYPHFESLIHVASGAPKDSNLEALARFSQWGVQQGIISQKQSEESLRRYFTPQLVSLEYHSDFNTYSHCSMSLQLSEIQTMMDHELEQKHLGLAEALGDIKSYRLAVKEHQSLKLLLENTSSACQAQS